MRISSFGIVLVASIALPSVVLADNLSEARKLLEQDRTRAAADVLKAVTEKDAEDAKAWALLADLSLKLGDLETADKAARNALDLAEKDPAVWKLVGRVAFERGVAAISARQPGNQIKSWFAEAEAKFKQCLNLDPEDKEIRWWMGWAKEYQEYPKRARTFYDEQIEKFPKEPGGYLRLGVMLSFEANGTDGGQTDAAKEIRKAALKVFDDGLAKAGLDAEILYNKGLALEWNGKKDDAKSCYLAAIDADPDFYKAWMRLYELKVPGSVIVPKAQKVLKKHKHNATAAYWAGYYMVWEKKYEESLAILLPALKEHGEHYLVYTQAFNAASGLLGSKPDLAVDALARIHEYYWYSGSSANNLGLYYRDKGSHEEAIAWYEKAVEREPESQNILNDYALMFLFHTSEKKKSLPLFLKVCSLVHEKGQKPQQGYWDTLENLCKYYWEVERDPEKVVKYAKMREETTDGVAPYAPSQAAAMFRRAAEKELAKRGVKPESPGEDEGD